MGTDPNFRFRINLSTEEIEFGGSESFVREMLGRIDEFAKLLKDKQEPTGLEDSPVEPESGSAHTEVPRRKANHSATAGTLDLPENFGEFLHQFPRELTDHDKALITGYFIQARKPENTFTTADVNELLQQQGLKLSNPSLAVRRNMEGKRRIFTVSQGNFRVAIDGVHHLKSLMESAK